MVQEFEKLFIKYTIAEIKRANKSVETMINALSLKRPDLGEYATSIADSVTAKDTKRHGREFQAEIIRVCNESENPQETAMNFFKACNLSEGQIKIINRNLRKVEE